MNTIFVKAKGGIIKATVIYNPFVRRHQVVIDEWMYNEFMANEEEFAIKYLRGSFPQEDIIKPDTVLLISDDNPLSNQCTKLTGDSYNTHDFEDLCKTSLIKHRRTGLIFQVISKREIREEYKSEWYYKNGMECFENDSPETTKRNLELKPGDFLYLGHVFKGLRQLKPHENFHYVTRRLQDIWRSKHDNGNTDWNIHEFYAQAEKADASEFDVFRMDNLFDVVPCKNFLGEYRMNKNKL
ncbi:hypothetical protein DW228_06410 [Bacteroides fragilis]|uniref:Uncharacterized protein n=1 Tax=Bacteroides fragilis TaxID=817 RepID=A0A396C827_BACFG|nr:hypothetical protein [Bacteroides fragilis]RHH14430.1 hypothetical protein DW228_06410 [Bacteroides fragilis]